MKRIIETLASLPADKMLHFFYGSLFSFVAIHFLEGRLAVLATFVLAVLKELYDMKKTGFSIVDIAFTVAPAIMYLGVLNIQ
jgi:hypothetical protein